MPCLFHQEGFVKGLMSQVGGDSLSSPASYQISSVFEVFDPSFPKAFKQKNKSQLSTFFVEWFLIASLTLAFFRKGSSCVWFIGCILIPILSWQIIPARKRVTIVIFDDPCPGRGRKKMSRFRLMVSQNLENVWSFSENLPNRWFSSPTWQDSYPPPHHPHLILTVVRREDVPCTRGIPGDTCRVISGGICSVCSGILGGVSRDTSEPKPLLIATLRRDLSLKDTLSRCCALVGPQRWLMHRNLHLETDFHYIPGTRTRNNHFFTVEPNGNGHRIWKNARQCTKLLETTVFKMKGQIQQMPKNRSKKCVLHDIKNKSRTKEQQSRMTGSGRNSLYRQILAYLVKPKKQCEGNGHASQPNENCKGSWKTWQKNHWNTESCGSGWCCFFSPRGPTGFQPAEVLQLLQVHHPGISRWNGGNSWDFRETPPSQPSQDSSHHQS